MIKRLNTPLVVTLLATALGAQAPLPLESAIRQAWAHQAGLQAGEAMVDRARAEASAGAALGLPTLSATAGWTRTDEPMMAFGLKLDQARIQAADFNPANLNRPEAVHGFGFGVGLTQPLYAGGRIRGAQSALGALAKSEAAAQAHRRQQVAYAVVQAYFGAQVARQGVAFAEDALAQAREVERFIGARVDQGLLLKSDLMRIRAWRAQADAGLAEARGREASARSALALLMGGPVPPELATPLEGQAPEAEGPGTRQDLEAARRQAEAARAGVAVAKGALRPEVGLSLGWQTARPELGTAGGSWTTAALGARWTFGLADLRRVQSARAAERAATEQVRWQEAQAAREVEEAGRAEATAQARLAAAREAVEAAESVRTLRQARHKEGLLPLTEVLDAETGLSGARALLLSALLDARLARAARALATGTTLEGVK